MLLALFCFHHVAVKLVFYFNHPMHFYLHFQGVNGYNKSAMQEAVFDVESELFNEGKNTVSA